MRVAAAQFNLESAQRLARRLAINHGVMLKAAALVQLLDPAASAPGQDTNALTEPRANGEKVLTYEEVDDSGHVTGRRAVFAGVEFTPLGYADLVDKKLSDEVTIPLDWKRAKVTQSNITEISVDAFASGHATLQSSYTSRAIGLVKGGWLPSGLAVLGNMIVLPDRCTISELKGRFRGGVKTNQDDKDFLDFFGGDGIRINPLLYALEGNLRKNPSPEQVRQQLEEVVAALRSALPKAELVPDGLAGLQGVAGIVQDTQASMERKQTFLVRIAPKLQAPTGARKRPQLWEEALTLAQECGIETCSLVVLAVLSSISVPMVNSPAKRVLKPTADYSDEDAYNALADLRSLEVLMYLYALFPDQRIMLCTGDKNLALFWAGIRASRFSWAGNAARFTLSPVEALLPNAAAAQAACYFDPPEGNANQAADSLPQGAAQ